MSRRRATSPGSLTSLLDVLFILVFASLVQSTARGEERTAAAAPADEPVATAPEVPAPPAAMAALRSAARAAVDARLTQAPLVVVRIAADGLLVELEHAERRPLGLPLLEQVADPDVAVAYLGDRVPALRVCGVVARELRTDDLSGHVVVIAPAVALAELPVAIVAGLGRDLVRCQREQGAMALVIEPAALAADRGASSAPGSGGSP